MILDAQRQGHVVTLRKTALITGVENGTEELASSIDPEKGHGLLDEARQPDRAA